LGQAGNTQDCACGRIGGKIVSEDVIQLHVPIHVPKINLNVNDVSHGQARCLDHAFYVIERLADLVRKICRCAAVHECRSLAGDIQVIPRVDS
jgi:hypothetical protein